MSPAFLVPQPHPSLEGHFPGEPILPGAVLLDEALYTIESAEGCGGRPWRIGTVKFPAAVGPSAKLTLHYRRGGNGAIGFTIDDGGRPVAIVTVAVHG